MRWLSDICGWQSLCLLAAGNMNLSSPVWAAGIWDSLHSGSSFPTLREFQLMPVHADHAIQPTSQGDPSEDLQSSFSETLSSAVLSSTNPSCLSLKSNLCLLNVARLLGSDSKLLPGGKLGGAVEFGSLVSLFLGITFLQSHCSVMSENNCFVCFIQFSCYLWQGGNSCNS